MSTASINPGIALEQVIPFYQPIYALKSRTVLRYECLARLLNSQQHLILPTEFLTIVENHEDRIHMTNRMLEMSQHYCRPRQMSWSINLFSADLDDRHLINELKYICANSTQGLCGIEVHFSHIKNCLPRLTKLLKQIPNLHITVDEITECSDTLKAVIASGVHAIKIKGELIKSHASTEEGLKTLSKFHAYCALHKCQLIAEHIEDEDTLKAVEAADIHFGQGFFLSQPKASFVNT